MGQPLICHEILTSTVKRRCKRGLGSRG
jgi:hypothetical protein